ncbi:MAG: hypothetical protein AAF288_01300 [Planctomycetota bacterium]
MPRCLHGPTALMWGTGFVALVGVLAVMGCASDTHQAVGRVIVGVGPRAEVVSANDPRLRTAPPARDVLVRSTLDPRAITPTPLPTVVSDVHGDFVIPIDAFGAGVLIYELELDVEGAGLRPLRGALADVPSSSKRLLITLPPADQASQQEPDLLRDTLELSRPYLRGER